jgi:hypothetical protein
LDVSRKVADLQNYCGVKILKRCGACVSAGSQAYLCGAVYPTYPIYTSILPYTSAHSHGACGQGYTGCAKSTVAARPVSSHVKKMLVSAREYFWFLRILQRYCGSWVYRRSCVACGPCIHHIPRLPASTRADRVCICVPPCTHGYAGIPPTRGGMLGIGLPAWGCISA